VLDGNLQKTMARNGLVVQTLSMTYSNSAVPESNLACSSGSYEGTCIGQSEPSPSPRLCLQPCPLMIPGVRPGTWDGVELRYVQGDGRRVALMGA